MNSIPLVEIELPLDYEPTWHLTFAVQNRETSAPETPEKLRYWICWKLLHHNQTGKIGIRRLLEFEGHVLISHLRLLESAALREENDPIAEQVRTRLSQHFRWACVAMFKNPGRVAEEIQRDLCILSKSIAARSRPKAARLVFDVGIHLEWQLHGFNALPTRRVLERTLRESDVEFSDQSLSEILIDFGLSKRIRDKSGPR